MLITSHVFLALALWLFAHYVERRWKSTLPSPRPYCLLALAVMPTGCFFRFGYSESLFLFLTVALMLAIEMRTPVIVGALLVALATGTRPVGVALLFPFAIYVFRTASSIRVALLRLAFYLPLSLSGLLAFCAFCVWTFDAPFAFADNMRHWHLRHPQSLFDKLYYLETLYPVWNVWSPSSYNYLDLQGNGSPVFSFGVANRICFVVAFITLLVGMRRRWLNSYETVLGWALLAIPYWFTAYEVDMQGMGRYVSVVVPIYIVAGRAAAMMPVWLTGSALSIAGVFLGLYTALFAARYPVF